MNKKCKVISGLSNGKKGRKDPHLFTNEEKHLIIQDFLESGCSKRDIWEKYTGDLEEHGQILKWMRKFGYVDSNSTIRPNFASKQRLMKEKKQKLQETESFEMLQLKKRIEELEKQLKDAEMRSIAYSTMVDIAEKEFNIPIRKKSNTKP